MNILTLQRFKLIWLKKNRNMYLFKATLSEPSFTLFLWQCKAFDAVFFVNVIISVCFSSFFMIQCMLINSNTGVNVTHQSSFFNISGIFALTVSWVIRELKQRRRWRLRKRHLKSEVALLQTLSRLFHGGWRSIYQMSAIFSGDEF